MDSTTLTGGTFATSSAAVTADTGATYYQLATTPNATTTIAITNALKFAQSKSVRTSTIILASFNSLAAFATAVGIIYGCRQYRQRMQRRASEPPSGLSYIHTVEVFPLLLCVGITVQSITFAAAQSVGLQALLSRGCTLVAVFMLPAVFIVPFIHLVFGIEAAVRGIRTQFAPRGRWNVSICLGVVATLVVVALVVAAVDKAPDFCFASLFWFLRTYAPGCFVVFLAISITLLIVIGIIFVSLNRSHLVDPIERMAASRMIYYLALGFISNAFIVPFFFSLTFLDQQKVILDTINLSMMASVVSNVNGLMVAGLHLFLKSQNNPANCNNLSVYERKKSMYDPRDRSDDYRGSNVSLQPVNGLASHPRGRMDSVSTLLHSSDAEEGRTMASPRSYNYGTSSRGPVSPKLFIPSGPTYPEPILPPSETSPSQMRKQSQSAFTEEPSLTSTAGLLPATTYSPVTSKPSRDTWNPPPIVKPWMNRSHKRDSSITSTATVQIGIRLSNVEDYVPRKSTDTEVPDVPEVPDIRKMPPVPAGLLPSPMPKDNRKEFEWAPEYMDTQIILDDPPRRRSSIQDARMKTLPPVPKSPSEPASQARKAAGPALMVEPPSQDEKKQSVPDEWVTLTPAVYTPQEYFPQRSLSTRSNTSNSSRKLPSPMGVGFNTPGGRGLGPNDRSPIHPPPRPSASTATTPLAATSTKADWI